ncbi:sigma-70 family RNA polymerase sigma factor [Anoxybacterium hadale]|uniref:Sigma-70 family RNA polymerase sigma factor n=1 Tax=Anoxybacterium hadale TaxID=3408580 RepID=A0ACD1A7Y4_9FIRM|nr:sigma-70 family RNA polymerase sigma factor [Clostridiales bacterium]
MFETEDIYQEYAQIIYKYLMSLCSDANLAEELTQETVFQAIKSSKRYDGSCKISTWLCQIAKHLWYQELDRRKRKGTVLLEDHFVSDDLTPEEQTGLSMEKMELFKAVHVLDVTSKEVILLRITGAFSFREIGEIFEKNENWARVTFYRAKQRIVKGHKK